MEPYPVLKWQLWRIRIVAAVVLGRKVSYERNCTFIYLKYPVLVSYVYISRDVELTEVLNVSFERNCTHYLFEISSVTEI